MTASAERIEFLSCWSDGALAMMTDGGYRDSSDVLQVATLEEVAAVQEHRAEREAAWIRSLTPAERAAYVESGELSADEVAKAMGVLTLAKPAATRPALVAHDEHGNEVPVGSGVVSFRGERATLVSLNRAGEPGRSGKVSVKWDGFDGSGEDGFTGEYYAGVFGLVVSVAE